MAGNATRSEANQSFFIYVKDTNTGVVKRVAIPGDMQVGLEGRPSELQLFGRLSVSSSTIAVNASNKGVINISNDNTVVAVSLVVTPASGRIRAYLPPTPRDGQLHFIKDASGTAGSVPIDIIPAAWVMIDGQSSQTLSDAYGSLALVWIGGQWRKLVAGLGASGGSGAPSNASYVTINAESGLTNERHLTGSTNLVMTDNGANASVYFDLTPVLGGGAGTFAAPTVTVDAWGRITAITAGTTGAPSNASYITVTNEPGLSAERRLTGSFGIKLVDGGANSNIVASFDPTLLIAGGNLLISASGGNLTLSDFDPWVDVGNKVYATSSVSIDPTGHVASFHGTDVFFYVSGSIASPGPSNSKTLFGGDVIVSGSFTVDSTYGITGSLTQLPLGQGPFIVGAGGIVVSTGSNSQVTVSGTLINSPVRLPMVAGTQKAAGATNVVLGGCSIDMSQFPSSYGALNRSVQFVADYNVAVATDQAQIQLWDATHGVTVTNTIDSATSTSPPRRFVSSALTVGSSNGNIRNDVIAQYQVQMAVTSGSITNNAVCYDAYLLIMYS